MRIHELWLLVLLGMPPLIVGTSTAGEPKPAGQTSQDAEPHLKNIDPNVAISKYTDAIRIDPKDASAYYNRAWVYQKTGSFDKAIADYSEAIRLGSKYSAA